MHDYIYMDEKRLQENILQGQSEYLDIGFGKCNNIIDIYKEYQM
jgi:hypothetical protein